MNILWVEELGDEDAGSSSEGAPIFKELEAVRL